MIRQLDATTMVGGQIQPADVAQLKAQGVSMIVCNRPDGEQPGQPDAADVQDAAEAAGIAFRHIPINRGIGPSDIEAMRQAIDDSAGGKMFAYCASGTRSALSWAVARRAQGESVEEIEKAARDAGVDLTPIAHLL